MLSIYITSRHFKEDLILALLAVSLANNTFSCDVLYFIGFVWKIWEINVRGWVEVGGLKVQERRGSKCIILIKCINIQHFDFNWIKVYKAAFLCYYWVCQIEKQFPIFKTPYCCPSIFKIQENKIEKPI